MNDDEMRVVRRAYAKQVLAVYGVCDEAVEKAFASVPRENFLGKGPWHIPFLTGGTYRITPSDDPVLVYTDDLVGLDPSKHLNNGQPSLHAKLIAAAQPAVGGHVVHLGAGVGYYSAILLHMVGATGKVTAIECDPVLGNRLTQNLASYPNASVLIDNSVSVDFERADVIYVNFGVTHPLENWLDKLADGGRMILPLATEGCVDFGSSDPVEKRGGVFVITRHDDQYCASYLEPLLIIPGIGIRDPQQERVLAAAFQRGGYEKVKRLYRTTDQPTESCWVVGDGWCLAY